MEKSTHDMRYYMIGFFDYILYVVAMWEPLDYGLRVVAAIGAIVATIYLIKKYRSETELNEVKKQRELLEIQQMQKENRPPNE